MGQSGKFSDKTKSMFFQIIIEKTTKAIGKIKKNRGKKREKLSTKIFLIPIAEFPIFELIFSAGRFSDKLKQ